MGVLAEYLKTEAEHLKAEKARQRPPRLRPKVAARKPRPPRAATNKNHRTQKSGASFRALRFCI